MNVRRDQDLLQFSEKGIEAVISEKVEPYGNGAKIKFSKKYIGKNVLVVVLGKAGSNK